MKRLKFLLLTVVCVAVLFCVATVTASAEIVDSGLCGTNVTYILDSEGTLTISGTGAMYGYSYDSPAPWYSSRASIKNVIIADGVTSIGSYAFYECSSFQSVTIGDSVTSIGSYVFWECISLQSITIPDSVTSIGYYVFRDCSSLKSVYINDFAKWFSIDFQHYESNPLICGGNLYLNGELVTDVTIPAGTTKIGYQFAGCTSLINVVIPDSVISIEERAFWCCTSLQSITIPDSVTLIGSWAFCNCDSLQSISIPDSVTYIGYCALQSCSSLQSIAIPDSVTSIGNAAFEYCCSLQSIIIPDTVTSIGQATFRYCSSLQSIIIPDSVTSIEVDAFSGCTALVNVTIPDSVIIIGDYAFEYCSSLQGIIIPDSVTSVGSYVFRGCSSLQCITIPDSVTSIGSYAFDSCTILRCVIFNGTSEQWSNISIGAVNYNLTNAQRYCLRDGYIVDGKNILNQSKTLLLCHYSFEKIYSVPLGIKSIDQNAFSGNKNLSVVILPEGLKNIGSYAFHKSNLNRIYIPDSVSTIDQYAFNNCSRLSDVYFGGTEEQFKSITVGNYNTYLKNATIHYNTKLIETDGAIYTEDMKTLVAISNQKEGAFTVPSTVTTINTYAFSDCGKITEILIPETVTVIENSAFRNCDGISEITLPVGITKLNNYVLYDCDNLQSITIPDNVTSIGEYAFYGCENLKTVSFNSALLLVGSYAFYGCKELQKLSLPEKLTAIGSYAFSGCSKLSEIYFPSSLTAIGSYAFSENSALTYVSLPDSVNSLGTYVFYKCMNLEKICLPEGTLASIPANAFNCCSKLTSIFIPEYITAFGDSAFYGCNNLSDIYYGDTEAEWDKISIVSSNSVIWAANVHFEHSHTNSNWQTMIEPEAHKTGLKSSICDVCSYEKREVVPITHTEISIDAINPTCSAIGYTVGVYCNDCEKYISGHREIPALGHVYGEWQIETEPTCTEVGKEIQYCIQGIVQSQLVDSSEYPYPESAHNYSNNVNETYSFRVEGATELQVTFNKNTKFESNYDYLYIYDAAGTQIGRYTGTSLAGQTITIPSGSMTLKLTSDGSNTAYGFKIDSIYTVINNSVGFEYSCDSYNEREIAALGHDEVSHDAKAPTCTEIGWDAYVTCSRCNYTTYAEKSALGHDEVNHDAKAPTCTAIGWDAYVTCSRCDYTTYVEKAINADAHKWDKGTITTNATCKVSGVKTYTCQHNALHKKTENLGVNASNHINTKNTEAVASTCSTVGYTAGVWCNDCEKYISGHAEITIDANAHNWDNGTITTTATCKVSGVKTYTCQHDATHKKTENLGVNASNHIKTKNTEAVASTCSTVGYTAGVWCNDCEKYISGHEEIAIDAEAHKWDNGTITTTATCKVNGVKTYTCQHNSAHTKTESLGVNASNHVNTKNVAEVEATCITNGYTAGVYCNDCQKYISGHTEIDAKGHTAVTDKGTAATCTTAGKTDGSHCSVCNAVIKAQENIPAKGHTAVTDKGTAATCTTAGKTDGSHCSVCNAVLKAQETVPAKCHTAVTDKGTAATCTTAGKTDGSHCSVCNAVIKAQETVPAKGHTAVTDKGTAATCTTAGKTDGSHCSVCNAVITAQENIPAKGHTAVTDKGTAATCTVAGKTDGSHCSVCNAVIKAQETVPTKGHTAVTDKGTAATCTTAGKTDGSHCSVCNAVIKAQENIPAKGHTAVTDKGTAATCTTTGKTDGSHCSVCNAVIKAQENIPAKGHTAVTDKGTAATCTTAGKTDGSHCSVCNAVITAQENIPAKGHTAVTDKGTAATCTTAGKTDGSHCSVCNTVIKAQENIPAKGHKWNNGAITTAATCKAKGVKTYTCQNDATHKKTEEIAVNASNHVNTKNVAEVKATCTTKGSTAGVYCNDCKKYISGYAEIAINPANHVNTKNVPETPATFENVGYTAGVYCSDCKKYISGRTEIPKLVATFTDSKDAKESGNDIISNNGLTVAQLLSQAGKGAVIKTTDGKSVENAALIGTGMVLTMADGSKKEIVVYGDVDGDGKISASDARQALRASVGLENFKEDSAKYKAAKRGSVDKLSAADARLILRASVGLEDPKAWMK